MTVSLNFIDHLLNSLPDGAVEDVRIGALWTAVVVDVAGHRRCGLAAALSNREYHHDAKPLVKNAGQLTKYAARELAQFIYSRNLLEAAIGMATVNALLPTPEQFCVDINARDVLIQRGAGKRIVMVGHFPFASQLREHVRTLWVLEQNPGDDDLPAEAAPEVIPQADIVAITGTTLINNTFEGLIALCRPEALVLVLGPSTPLSPILFDYGVHLLSGSIVEDVEAVLPAVSQGANFRQLRQQGVRLVTMQQLKRGNTPRPLSALKS
jgi:uncharacterized protein (DUF4213/DUF364 family)